VPARPPAASQDGAGGDPQPERGAADLVARQLQQLAASGAPHDRAQLQALTLQLHEQLPHLSTHQLSRAASTLARLGWRPSATLAALCSSALERLDAFGTLDLVWLLWALGRLQYSTSLSKKLAKESLALLLERQARQPAPPRGAGAQPPHQQQAPQRQGLSELDAASLLWACARLGYRNDLLLEPLLELLLAQHSPYQQQRQQQQQQQGRAPDARTAANVVWACARLGLQQRQLQDWAQAAELEQAAPQAVANIVWGLWKLGEPRPGAGAWRRLLLPGAAGRCGLGGAAGMHAPQGSSAIWRGTAALVGASGRRELSQLTRPSLPQAGGPARRSSPPPSRTCWPAPTGALLLLRRRRQLAPSMLLAPLPATCCILMPAQRLSFALVPPAAPPRACV
jgi:hypothetical protein